MPDDALLTTGLHAAVIGTTDVDAATAWFDRLGFTHRRDLILNEHVRDRLYPGSPSTVVRELGRDGADHGLVRLVAAPVGARAHDHPWGRGPYGVLVYSRDIRASLELARGDGARPSDVAGYQAGAKLMQEARAIYPDGLVVVFVQLDDRRPSLLDHDADAMHSEVHSITFVVDDLDEAIGRWEALGLTTLVDLTIADPNVTGFMGLPRPEAPVRLAMLSDPVEHPARLELMTFPEDPGPWAPPVDDGVPIGLFACAVVVDDLDTATSSPGATLGEVMDLATAGRCRILDLGQGQRVELWDRP